MMVLTMCGKEHGKLLEKKRRYTQEYTAIGEINCRVPNECSIDLPTNPPGFSMLSKCILCMNCA